MKINIKEKAQPVAGYVELNTEILDILLEMVDNAKKDPSSLPASYLDAKYTIDITA